MQRFHHMSSLTLLMLIKDRQQETRQGDTIIQDETQDLLVGDEKV